MKQGLLPGAPRAPPRPADLLTPGLGCSHSPAPRNQDSRTGPPPGSEQPVSDHRPAKPPVAQVSEKKKKKGSLVSLTVLAPDRLFSQDLLTAGPLGSVSRGTAEGGPRNNTSKPKTVSDASITLSGPTFRSRLGAKRRPGPGLLSARGRTGAKGRRVSHAPFRPPWAQGPSRRAPSCAVFLGERGSPAQPGNSAPLALRLCVRGPCPFALPHLGPFDRSAAPPQTFGSGSVLCCASAPSTAPGTECVSQGAP